MAAAWRKKTPEAHVGKLGAMPTSAHTPLGKNRSESTDDPRENTLAPITVRFTSQTCPAASLTHSLLYPEPHCKSTVRAD